MIPTPKQKTLLQKVLQQQLIRNINLYHLHNVCVSIEQDVVDEISEVLLPQKQFKYAQTQYLECLEREIKDMQMKVGDDQLLTLQNNECMKLVLKKLIECTKNGSIEGLANLILDYQE